MAKMTMVQALNLALRQEMEKDDRVIVLGEDVGRDGGVFRVTDGLAPRLTVIHPLLGVAVGSGPDLVAEHELLGQVDKVSRMQLVNRLGFATGHEELMRKLADGLQHGEARFTFRTFTDKYQVFINQGDEQIQEIPSQARRTDALDTFQNAPAAKHCQAGQQALFILLEKVGAPFDCGAQGALPGREIARASGQRPQTMFQALGQL